MLVAIGCDIIRDRPSAGSTRDVNKVNVWSIEKSSAPLNVRSYPDVGKNKGCNDGRLPATSKNSKKLATKKDGNPIRKGLKRHTARKNDRIDLSAPVQKWRRTARNIPSVNGISVLK